jgi:hypothetical protein
MSCDALRVPQALLTRLKELASSNRQSSRSDVRSITEVDDEEGQSFSMGIAEVLVSDLRIIERPVVELPVSIREPRAGHIVVFACLRLVCGTGVLEGRIVEVEADIGAGPPRTVLLGTHPFIRRVIVVRRQSAS